MSARATAKRHGSAGARSVGTSYGVVKHLLETSRRLAQMLAGHRR
jgi:hypothetical protein